jgi:hypothetical protein
MSFHPFGTSATNWPTVPTPDEDDECGAVGEMRIGRGNRCTRRKRSPLPVAEHSLKVKIFVLR